MNKKILAIFIVAALTLFPKTSRADLDVLSIVQDQITSITEKVNAVVKQYSTIQANLQELSLNRNIVSQLKDKVKGELKAKASQFITDVKDTVTAEGMMFLKTSLSSISLPGIGQYIDLGAFVNPKLTVAVGKTYLKKQHQNNDVQKIVAQDERSNNLMVDNLAIIFANSLVHRKQIIDEDPCSCVDGDGQDCNVKKQKCEEQEREFNEMSDVNVVKNRHYVVMLNANHRWLKIKEAVAQLAKIEGESLMNQGTLDDVSAVTGEIDDTKEEEASEEEVKQLIGNRMNPLDLTNRIKGGLDNIKNGNYAGALSDGLKTASDMYGNAPGSHENVSNLLQNASTGANALNGVYSNSTNNNLGGALNSALNGAGEIMGNTGNENLSNIFNNAAGSTGNALNSALNGDWGSAISNAGNSANTVLSGTDNNTLGATIGAGGNLLDVGIDAANSGGNFGDILNNTAGNGQAQNALSSLQGAYDNENKNSASELAAQEEANKKLNEELQKSIEEEKKKIQEAAKEESKRKCQECRNNARASAEAAVQASGKTGTEAQAEIEMQINMKCQLLCFGVTGL